MKIIDEKGRFFGRINVIDLLVLLGVVVVAFVLVGKMVGNKGAGLAGQAKLTYTVKVCDVDAQVYESIQNITFPDQLMASGNLLNANVVSVTPEKSQGQVYEVLPNTQGGMELKTGENDSYDLTFTIEAFVPDNAKNEVGTQEVRVGKTHIVKTSQLELEKGIILSCEKETAS